jgi:hypothetical protein
LLIPNPLGRIKDPDVLPASLVGLKIGSDGLLNKLSQATVISPSEIIHPILKGLIELWLIRTLRLT